MKIRRFHLLLLLLIMLSGILLLRDKLRRMVEPAIQLAQGKKTVADRVAEFGQAVHRRLDPDFARAGMAYPPKQVKLVGLKSERLMQVWVSGSMAEWKHLKNYPILGMSGTTGPKLRAGDMQVPEGLYRVESLNPNSRYHVALRVDYPNQLDRKHAQQDGRTNLGGDIMIHGKNCSIGCLAMGDDAAEDLFVLTAETGINNVSIILSPVDFRIRDLPHAIPQVPSWTGELYELIKSELTSLGKP